MTGTQNSNIWQEKNNASGLTMETLGHYIIHRQIVLRKLELAQNVTAGMRKSDALKESKNIFEWLKIFFFYKLEAIDTQWNEIIDLFNHKVVYEDDLFYIEELLAKIPQDTRVLLDKAVAKDRKASGLQKKIKTEQYREAKQRIKRVQDEANPLTGLTAEGYEQDLLRHIKDVLFQNG